MQQPPTGSGERLVHLIKLIASGPIRFALSDLAARAGLPVSSVHRLLQVLVRTGFVERGEHQFYQAGRELLLVAGQLRARFDLVRAARPFLEQLAARFQETVGLYAYRPASRDALIADVIFSPHPLRYNLEVGQSAPLAWGVMGRAILAQLSPGEIDAVLATAPPGPYTGRQLPPPEQMQALLSETRARGYHRNLEPEYQLAGLAAPILATQGMVLGSIGIALPPARFTPAIEAEMAAAVMKAAAAISALASEHDRSFSV